MTIATLAVGCANTPPATVPPEARSARSAFAHRSPLPDAGAVAITPEAGEVRPPSREPPMSLTAADGTALRLVDLHARTVVADPLAFTEVRLTFDNPDDRVIEGRFQITLPAGAAVSRFAMRIDERWQEGEVLELARARRTYEDFLHQKQDPALLEQAAGNAFSARVFPIAARARKELIVAYSQPLAPGTQPLVPLAGLPEVERVDVGVRAYGSGASMAALAHADHRPERDFVLDAEARRPGPGLQAGDLALIRLVPPVPTRPEPLDGVVVLLDTSASRALGFEAQLRALTVLAGLVAQTDGARLAVGCFDQDTQLVFDGPATGFGDAALATARRRGALGASDLPAALRWAGALAAERGLSRVVVIGDGVATAGVADEDAVIRAAAALGSSGVQRLDALAAGGLRDDPALRGMITAGLPRAGVVVEADSPATEIARKLTHAALSGVPLRVAGASWWHPRTLDGVQPGDEVLVHAELAGGAAPELVQVGELEIAIPPLRSAPRALLLRSWARARIDGLLEQQARKGASEAIRKQVVEISTRHRVMSPYTGLLVLETEADYARFGIGRDALADILAIDGGQLVTVDRPAFVPPGSTPSPVPLITDTSPVTTPPPVDPLAARGNVWGDDIGSAFGAGGLGLSGIGEGGGGRGQGIGMGSVGTLGARGRADAPRIRMGASSVSGRLPPEVIQRIVRTNFGRFRACYEAGLRPSPGLHGRVSVRFVIARDGSVSRAEGSGDLPDRAVIDCVARAFRGLSFPQPEGGVVTVLYPIVFSPGDGAPSPAEASSPGRSPADSPPPRPPAPPPVDQPAPADPYAGRFAVVMDAIARADVAAALASAEAWRRDEPGEVLALVALGEALEANGRPHDAARSYGSILDLFPARADMRRHAASRLERVAGGVGLPLAVDSYRVARSQRPDHPSSHRLLAFALLAQGEHEAAFRALREGLTRSVRWERFPEVERVLREDLGLIAAAWLRAEPARRAHIAGALAAAKAKLAVAPSLRFVLTWETDANDVDLHVFDGTGHASYANRVLPSGGQLYADVTTGFGPECFTIDAPAGNRSDRYTLQAHYYSRGPMGYGMGKLQVIEHDGRGTVRIDDRPFVVMKDQAYVDLGVVERGGS